MSTELYRKYIDIVNENSQEKIQLDEGIMDAIKAAIPKLIKSLGGETVAQLAQQVKNVTNGDLTLSKENAIKVAKAFEFDKMIQDKEGKPAGQLAEGEWGIAGNWKGKILQLIHFLGVTGSAIGLYANSDALFTKLLAMVGFMLLLVTDTFYSKDPGMVGAMGNYDDQGNLRKK